MTWKKIISSTPLHHTRTGLHAVKEPECTVASMWMVLPTKQHTTHLTVGNMSQKFEAGYTDIGGMEPVMKAKGVKQTNVWRAEYLIRKAEHLIAANTTIDKKTQVKVFHNPHHLPYVSFLNELLGKDVVSEVGREGEKHLVIDYSKISFMKVYDRQARIRLETHGEEIQNHFGRFSLNSTPGYIRDILGFTDPDRLAIYKEYGTDTLDWSTDAIGISQRTVSAMTTPFGENRGLASVVLDFVMAPLDSSLTADGPRALVSPVDAEHDTLFSATFGQVSDLIALVICTIAGKEADRLNAGVDIPKKKGRGVAVEAADVAPQVLSPALLEPTSRDLDRIRAKLAAMTIDQLSECKASLEILFTEMSLFVTTAPTDSRGQKQFGRLLSKVDPAPFQAKHDNWTGGLSAVDDLDLSGISRTKVRDLFIYLQCRY